MPATQTPATESATINAFAVATLAASGVKVSLTGCIVELRVGTGPGTREALIAAQQATKAALSAAGIDARAQSHKVNPADPKSAKTLIFTASVLNMGCNEITARYVQFRIAA